jgi:hypothetical protein
VLDRTGSQVKLAERKTAKLCSAWSIPTTDMSKQEFFAVLLAPEVVTAAKVVQASIISDLRK